MSHEGLLCKSCETGELVFGSAINFLGRRQPLSSPHLLNKKTYRLIIWGNLLNIQIPGTSFILLTQKVWRWSWESVG